MSTRVRTTKNYKFIKQSHRYSEIPKLIRAF